MKISENFDCYRNFSFDQSDFQKNLAFSYNQTSYLNREMGRYGSHGNLSEIKIKGSLIRRAMISNYELQTIFLSRFHSNTSSRHELALTFHLADSAPKVNRNCKRTGKKVFQLIKEYKWDWNHQSPVPSSIESSYTKLQPRRTEHRATNLDRIHLKINESHFLVSSNLILKRV